MILDFYCNYCNTCPILDCRWRCQVCDFFDLCDPCYRNLDAAHMPAGHTKDHPMLANPVFTPEQMPKTCSPEDVKAAGVRFWSSDPKTEPPSTSDRTPSSTYFSTRIRRITENRGRYGSNVEADIAASKDHWSELISHSTGSEGAETNKEIFRSLKKQWGGFFNYWGYRFVLGEKIAEGGQAEIFKAELMYEDDKWDDNIVLKVFKEGYSLRDLQSQWPLGMLQNSREVGSYWEKRCCVVHGGTVLANGRFAFLMSRYWGDLRKLIDLRMRRSNNCGPPFPIRLAKVIMMSIAQGMKVLHEHGISHRDLKASNVLIRRHDPEHEPRVTDSGDDFTKSNHIDVADFESSVGVVGTGFWRAPEILQAMRDRRINSNFFTKEVDVYSYGMTCFEILTGRLPFEDHSINDFDVVLSGRRPELPPHLDPSLDCLLTRCWHKDPSLRPTFSEIVAELEDIQLKDRQLEAFCEGVYESFEKGWWFSL